MSFGLAAGIFITPEKRSYQPEIIILNGTVYYKKKPLCDQMPPQVEKSKKIIKMSVKTTAFII